MRHYRNRRRTSRQREAKRIRSARGRFGTAAGALHEETVFLAFTDRRARFPSWFRAIRPPTHREDQRGIDAVVDTDVGQLHLQIKSSIIYAARFKGRPGHDRIAVVIVHTADSSSCTRRKVLQALRDLRRSRISFMTANQPPAE